MNLDQHNPDKVLTPEQLAAYADGELPAPEMQAAETWLRTHPEAAAELECLRRLSRLCQEHAAPEPNPAVWDKTLHGIEGRLRAPKPGRGPKGGFTTPRILLVLAAAALAGVLVARAFWPTPGGSAVTQPIDDQDEPYPVATADEIVIVSMDPRNSQNLVVGRRPIHGDMELVGPEDVDLVATKPNNDGQMPEMRYGGNVPVIVPTASWGGKED